MMLWQRMAEMCRFVQRISVPDGEGGSVSSWCDGDPFPASIVRESTDRVRVAESDSASSAYTVTVSRDVPLCFHAVFRRLSDGAVFRVISRGSDNCTPDVASFSFQNVKAERWVIPD